MLEKIETLLNGECRLDPHKPIVVGVSGGPDSLCLMDNLHQAGYLVVIAHFNHKLRPEAEAEASAVKVTARELAIPFVMESGDVNLHAQNEKLSIEEAARNLRYRFLFTQAHRFKAQAVAVGHTADDQVETVLMHFLRGAGLNGLQGMSYRSQLPIFDAEIPIVRPLLDTWRTETVAYCASHNLIPHYDPSNDAPDFLRNRLRNTLIPTLETYNPRFREAVWRSAKTISSDQALLGEALAIWWKQSVLQETEDYVKLDLDFLSGQTAGLQRQLVRRAIQGLLPSQEIVYSVLETSSAFIADPSRVRMDLIGGLVLFREANALYIARPDAELPLDPWPQMPKQMDSMQISLPAQISLSGGWQFSSEEWQLTDLAWERSSNNEDRFRVWLDADKLSDKLELRIRRPGDHFEPLGLKGHSQKLSDFFTNVKLPLRVRARWPLLCSGDTVIWVPGYRLAERFKLNETSRNILYFSLACRTEKTEI
jgi:tRNA(Ile)-lysidine synthase